MLIDLVDVRVGQTVAKGQKIGIMGSTSIHLHFEITQNGQLKNSIDFFNR
ncbi:M23 family metallopeptidase [Halalkalibacter nanhaiisediminis]|uniref:Peptidase M23-like protein n=1 Tax=Halalkalibacter nanhaiisediminis TaxID=688079 RepID=A0A562QSJ7_9BACI|nr:M23 family metallopeptidase [Halalkalibacter nanhaiisediminis]TWI59633.1 peptidase M23-like protein [Halalkalibacter nanhaiisediminis]